jgi:hypothetical protein
MDYAELKAGVKEIAEIAASTPERFRDKCFELLLSNLLGQESAVPPSYRKDEPSQRDAPRNQDANRKPQGTIPMKTQLRLLMKKTDVTPEELERIVMYDNDEIHFIKEPHDTGISAGQMDWALLLALKNAILKDSMSTDPEDVRSVCRFNKQAPSSRPSLICKSSSAACRIRMSRST